MTASVRVSEDEVAREWEEAVGFGQPGIGIGRQLLGQGGRVAEQDLGPGVLRVVVTELELLHHAEPERDLEQDL